MKCSFCKDIDCLALQPYYWECPDCDTEYNDNTRLQNMYPQLKLNNTKTITVKATDLSTKKNYKIRQDLLSNRIHLCDTNGNSLYDTVMIKFQFSEKDEIAERLAKLVIFS